MQTFSDFNITTTHAGFTGDKIKIKKVINRKITVHAYQIKKSNYDGKGDCLYLQIELEGTKHLLFSGSKVLMEQIQKVPAGGFPFVATIIEEDNGILKFT